MCKNLIKVQVDLFIISIKDQNQLETCIKREHNESNSNDQTAEILQITCTGATRTIQP